MVGAETLERGALKKIWWRCMPLMIALLFFSFLDRVNIGFAALRMNQDLGFSNTVFGVGAGFYSIGYAAFAIPSTLGVARFGARVWISVMAVAWGLCSAGTAFVSEPKGLIVCRFLLGVAEAGFSPSVILYLAQWFPSRYRGRALSSLLFIMPLSLVIGGPVSTALVSTANFGGLVGWQWLFIAEALPTLVLAMVVFWTLTDLPANARWLSAAERTWLKQQLRIGDARPEGGQAHATLRQALLSGRVWALAAVYAAIGTCGTGAVLFLPMMIRSMGFSIWNTGFMSAVPAVAAAALMPLWGLWADRSGSRERVVAVACGLIAIGLYGTAVLLPSVNAVVPLCATFIGFYGSLAPFWTLPTAFLTRANAAAGVAFINIAGNLGNFIGPAILGRFSDRSQSYASGLTWLAVIAVGGAMTVTAQSALRRGIPGPA